MMRQLFFMEVVDVVVFVVVVVVGGGSAVTVEKVAVVSIFSFNVWASEPPVKLGTRDADDECMCRCLRRRTRVERQNRYFSMGIGLPNEKGDSYIGRNGRGFGGEEEVAKRKQLKI